MAVAVICEFNPFHNGHKYLINRVKTLTNEPVIAIMSGSFTQRGEVALASKFVRARVALQNGADLVAELPSVYAVACAERFARAGVAIAASFDCVSKLAFGCENDVPDELYRVIKAKQNPQIAEIIKEKMKSGDYYPRAFESAVREVYGDITADVLKGANNTLAVEYIGCLEGTGIEPLPIKRIGVEHDSKVQSGDFASASLVRARLRQGESADWFIPAEVSDITYPEKLETAMLYRLRGMSAADFAELPEVNEGLENRIYDAVRNYNSVKEIIDNIKTKRYTHSRIRRILTNALLGITDALQNTPIDYVRVLGFTDNGATLLKSCRINVVTSVGDAIRQGGNAAELLKKDIFATDIAALAYNEVKKTGADFTTPIIKV